MFRIITIKRQIDMSIILQIVVYFFTLFSNFKILRNYKQYVKIFKRQ